MKKLLLSVALIVASFMSSAQVGINTITPEGALDVVSENSGIVLPRVANVSEVTSPVNGMMVYDIFNNCFRGYENGTWSNCLSGAETTSVVSTGPCQGQPEEFTFNGLTYKPVVSNSKCWLDRNLGASQVATSSTDYSSYGDLYQWGRKNDGHEVRTPSPDIVTGPVVAENEGIDFITANASPYDWLIPQDDLRWNSDATTGGVIKTGNDPCPTGYRVPTKVELQAELDGFSSTYAAGALASSLKLPMAGGRGGNDGLLGFEGTYGAYWSGTVDGFAGARGLSFSSDSASMAGGNRTNGFSVRCIKE